jgi:enoyl-CoA hydratase/carnithine racemase
MIDVVLEGPGKNALGTAVMAKALATIRAAEGEPLLVTGAGDVFSAGLDLREVAGHDVAGLTRYLDLLDELVLALFHHPAPTVAAIQGHAIAGGCVIAMCCDHRVMTASPRAKIGLNEVALGLLFPPRVLALAKARVPITAQRRVLLGAGLYAPAEALSLGLCDELADDAVAAGRGRLAELAAHPRAVYAETKKALQRGLLDLDERELAHYRDVVLPTWTSPELRASLAARLAKK